MKKYTYILLMILGVMMAQCTPEDLATPDNNVLPEEKEEDEYTNSYWYYSYEATNLITWETLEMENKDEFIPYTVAHLGDTLFVANIGTAGSSLTVFSQKENKALTTLRTWEFGGKEWKFGSNIESIVPASNRLYVTERQSYIHVFQLPELSYITSIGNGLWSGHVFQAQAVTVKDRLIFARDKNGKISIYKESDATTENHGKANRYRQASDNGSHGNNGFATHYMQPDDEGNILLTEYTGNKIRVLNPALVNDDMVNGDNIDIEDRTMTLDFSPKTLALSKDRWYATGNNNAINIYDCQKKEWISSIKSVKGYSFVQPERIYAQNDSVFWISDINSNKRTLVKMEVHKGEIRD